MSHLTTDEVIERLKTFARRLYASVIDAVALHSAFRSLNESEEWRKAIFGSPIAHAANIMQHAMLRELILVLVRVLDKPKNIETSDKVSFAVIGRWLERDEIREALAQQGRSWHGEDRADENEEAVRNAIGRVRDRLERLATEDPNRERKLRDYRDEFLAHELHLEIPRDKPMFGHIKEMTDEIEALCKDTMIAITGYDLAFDYIATEAKEGADELWKAVATQSKR